MNTAPASSRTQSPEQAAIRQGFHVVEAVSEPQRPGLDASVVYVDYNSRPAIARQIARLNWFNDFSLSISGVILLACCVCLITTLACLFLLPRI